MKNKNNKSNQLYLVGIVLIAVELLIFLAARKTILPDISTNDKMVYVFLNHAITIIYLLSIVVLSFIRNKWRFLKMDKRHFITFLSLAYITAHTLNEEIVIFSRYPEWLNILLISIFICLHLIDYIDRFNSLLKSFILFMLGIASIVILYFTIYLIPFFFIGLIGLFFFGLTIYLFVPLFVLVTIIYHFIKIKETKNDKLFYFAGVALPFIILFIFLLKWQTALNEIDRNSIKYYQTETELPSWITLGQHLPKDKMTQKILSSGLCYDQLGYFGNWSNNMSNTMSEKVQHDPLIIIAQLIFGEIPLSDDECLKIIEYQYDARHEVYRKLWSGKHLETKQIQNDIQIFPEYRLAYIEKTITIANNNRSNWSQQEALYTFYLPEGAVASSLSLWINGKEEKSRLTTKAKADSAYQRIVGVESRDPALLHWQEGSQITVTVFPCTPKEDRIFKVGLTVPLTKKEDKLILKSINFKGPNFNWTDEQSNLEIISNAKSEVQLPSGYNKVSEKKYVYEGKYKNNDEIIIAAPSLSSQSFSFNNKSFHLAELLIQKVKFSPSTIYLDINKSWTKKDLNRIIEKYSNKRIYAYDNKLIEVNKENSEEIYYRLNGLNFSLFPIYLIADPKSSLLISKSTMDSPNLNELKSTGFGKRLSDYLKQNHEPINLINLGSGLSPYLKSLNEFEIFNYAEGTTETLNDLFNKELFPLIPTKDNEAGINSSKIKIVQSNAPTFSEAPDHLMRLFAYQKILKETGKSFFLNDKNFQESLIDVANEAYIVSPISSLVVLETIKDYERFNINKNENTLENAVKNSSGAVPEPHEWALIILAVVVIGFLYFKR